MCVCVRGGGGGGGVEIEGGEWEGRHDRDMRVGGEGGGCRGGEGGKHVYDESLAQQ